MNVCKNFLEKFPKHWVVHKKKLRFSAISIDQTHELHNALVKGGGAIGLTENPMALRRHNTSKNSFCSNVMRMSEYYNLPDFDPTFLTDAKIKHM